MRGLGGARCPTTKKLLPRLRGLALLAAAPSSIARVVPNIFQHRRPSFTNILLTLARDGSWSAYRFPSEFCSELCTLLAWEFPASWESQQKTC
mmetsp:Transcript_587/g.2471  ORF Transcript_587/g.2471 Transcript_587/m.2471 type:complete len:93 (+) Transcript_587:402-680(+)